LQVRLRQGALRRRLNGCGQLAALRGDWRPAQAVHQCGRGRQPDRGAARVLRRL